MHRPSSLSIVVLGAAVMLLVAPLAVQAKDFSGWGTAVPVAGVNTTAAEGCPIESPDGRSLYIASNRAGGVGTPDPNDIYVAHRSSKDAAWGPLVNVGAPVNSAAADFCPTPLTGKRLLFVSTRSIPGTTCGAGDIYLTRRNPAHGWATPVHLGCDATGTGPNFPGGEFGPSLVTTAEGTFLYFSSSGYGTSQDIYVSRRRADGTFAPATVVAELSSPAEDVMPNVSRNGLEVVFASTRAGAQGQDIYTAHRASTSDPWSTPVRLGPEVNTAGTESRPSLSADGERLLFGRDGDIYVSTRTKVTGR